MVANLNMIRAGSAYALVQLATGIELGALIAVGVLCWNWDAATIAAISPAGLVLVAFQIPLVYKVLDRLSGR